MIYRNKWNILVRITKDTIFQILKIGDMMQKFYMMVSCVALGVSMLSGCQGSSNLPAPVTTDTAATPSTSPAIDSTRPATSPAPSSVQQTKKPTPAVTKATITSSKIFPQVLGPWKSVKNEGSYESHGVWVQEFDIETTMGELNSQRCDGNFEDPLLVPQHIVGTTYEHSVDSTGAYGLALQFANQKDAETFLNGYKIIAKTCEKSGSTPFVMRPVQDSPVFIGRKAVDGEQKRVEMAKIKGDSVVMFIVDAAQEKFTDGDLKKFGKAL